MTEASPSARLAQKNVLVTGAASGLGRHIAQAFAAEGADIAILDFQDASATVREITALKRRCEFFRSDVRDEDGVKTAVAGAADFFGGRIDVLVNNAGFNGHYSLIKDMPLAHWRARRSRSISPGRCWSHERSCRSCSIAKRARL
jgi:2-hydroxycyclohexanecarboxyl-CoA dehydrogenase